MVKRESRVRISLLSFLCSLFLTLPLPATAQLPEAGLPNPESLVAGSSPLETLDVRQIDAQIQQNQTALEQTRQQLAELENKIADLAGKEQAGLAKVAALEEQISLTRRYLVRLRDQAAARTREVAQVARQVQKTTSEMTTRRQNLGRRLTGIYKYGRLNTLASVLSTRSMPEVYRKMLYLRWIARTDRRVATELSELNLQLALQRSRLLAARTELDRLEQEQLAHQASLNSSQAAESALLKKLRSEKAASEEMQRQLSQSAGRLKQLLSDLERRREQAQTPAGRQSQFAGLQGKLPWPLRGKVIAGFGSQVHPRYKTKTSNLGIDIKAAPGATVQAVAPGRVAYADQFMGYGNLVILDHGSGFYTLYSNLDEMSVGVGSDVGPGTRVGTAGDYLHFEIRKDGKPVNPVDWLRQ
jgi:septal ring factor EnvC (AmiA/AmiB activator)